MQDLIIRPIEPNDHSAILALNNAAIPAVNELTPNALNDLLDEATFTRIALKDGSALAFIIAFSPGKEYQSPNYQWFSRQYSDFMYVDRIVVRPNFTQQSIGSALYRQLTTAFPESPVVCEVNTKPANPQSMRFHERQGFVQVGSQTHDEIGKAYAYLLKEPSRGTLSTSGVKNVSD